MWHSTISALSTILGSMSQSESELKLAGPSDSPSTDKPKQKPEHGILNLVFNVIVPAVILHKASNRLGPLPALLIALAFPLGFGIYDLWKKKKWNPLSILGFTNVLVTGSLAVLGLGGIWFSIKEAFFPFAIGVFVWFSAKKEKPLIHAFLINHQTMHVDTIDTKLRENQKEKEFVEHLQFSTKLLAGSFFFSAILNFFLAQRIFVQLDANLDATALAVALNQQIGEMTAWSAGVIVVPSTCFLIYILWYLLKGIRELTGLTTEQILKG